MKFIYLFSVFCLSVSSVFGQDLFEKGFLVKHSGERVEVFIDIYPLYTYPDSIRYKKTRKSEVEIGTTDDISFFQVSNFRFIRFNGYIDFNLKPTSNPQPDLNPTDIFIRQELTGAVNLYEYRLEDKQIFFYAFKDKDPQQLFNIEFIRPDGVVSINRLFRSQLQETLTCNQIKNSDIENLSYDINDLKEIISKYNSCKNSETVTYSGPSPISTKYLNIAILAGNTTYSIVSTTQINNILLSKFKGNAIPNLGLELEYLFPFSKNKFSLWGRVDYKNITDTGVATIEGQQDTSSLSYQTIESSFGGRWYFNRSNILKVFADVGIAKSYEVGDGVFIDYQTKTDFDNAQFPIHFVFGAGIIIRNRFVLDTRLEYLKSRLSELDSGEDVNFSMLTVNLKFLLKSYYK
tara:strand:+ start:25919 stop:27133 length:1215 start_codon:yes stop_codon:yes gene_type:complete